MSDSTFSYTFLAVVGVILTIGWDLKIVKTRLLTTKIFWASYAIVVFFQLVSNGILTGFQMVRYYDDAIVGSGSVADGTPQMIGDGRIFYAPFEDLLFGFALVVLSMSLWVMWERRGLQKNIRSGPPRVGVFGAKK